MSNPLTNMFGLHANALPLREQRMQLIASNLANADTPNYRARDIDFQAALGAAADAASATGLQRSNPEHLAAPGAIGGGALIERPGNQPSLDGNTVDSDIEHAAFARAALEYRASLSFLEARVRNLLTAITGQ